MPESNKTTDAELWRRLVEESSEAAFRELMARHRSLVWGVCSRVLRGSDAEDAFQMAFLALLEHGGRIRAPDFGPWLYRVAFRAALRVRAGNVDLEKLAEANGSAGASVNADVFQQIEQAEQCQLMEAAVDSLPEKYREVLVLHYGEGLPRDEIARRLNLTIPTVKARLARGREALRSRLLRRGISLSVAAYLLESPVYAAEASPALLDETWRLVARSLAGEPVSLAKTQFSDYPETEYGMNLFGTVNTKWAVGAAVAALALFLVFEAGKANGSAGGAGGSETSTSVSSVISAGPSRIEAPEPDRLEPSRLVLTSASSLQDVPANADVAAANPVASDFVQDLPPGVRLQTATSAAAETAGPAIRSGGLPNGRWKRTSVLGTIEFEVKESRVLIEFQGSGEVAGLAMTMRGEHATASDGTVFGLIHAVDMNLNATLTDGGDMSEQLMMLSMLNDLPFAMRVHAEPDAMMVKSMTVGVPGMIAGEETAGLGMYAVYLCGSYAAENARR